jgi:cytochrome c oxidase cbb3-type subunit III
MSTTWSIYIIVITVFMLLACFWLLIVTRKKELKSNTKKENETLSHEFDGIKEFDHPLPAWWLNLFYLSLFFGIGYLIFFPGLGGFPGILNWSSESQLQKENIEAKAKIDQIFAQYANLSISDLSKERMAYESGQKIFLNHCAACHGADAKGAVGFPNLTDQDFLYGKSGEAIVQSITKGRSGVMPAFGGLLKESQVREVALYVQSFSGDPKEITGERQVAIAAGRDIFAVQCAVCHGADAKGNPFMGAPNLTDAVWLYGGDEATLVQTIQQGRSGKMPAHESILDALQLKLVASYVYRLSANE